MRVRPWALPLLLMLLAAGWPAFSCGGGSGNGQVNIDDVPTATLPSTLPAPLIVSGTPRRAGGTYVVQSGDNPSAIADRFGITAEELMAANGITDPTALYVGQELVIPGAQNALGEQATPRPTATTEAATATPQPTAPSTGGQIYVVQEGDIPETIAAQFGITAEELMAANGITDPTSLQIGQTLVIPTPQPAP